MRTPASLVALLAASAVAKEYRAMVYRSPAVCKNCPGALEELLESSPQKFKVTFAGPGEDVKVTADSLRDMDLFAYGGGPDVDSAWNEIKDAAPALRDFVAQGGRYVGVCLGAFLAGYTPGLGLLPQGADVDREIEQRGSQVRNDSDTIIQVDWTFQSATGDYKPGQKAEKRWAYFQDGVAITGLSKLSSGDQRNDTVLARYSQSGDVAASRTPHGNGWVVLVGIHPEATPAWYKRYNLSNPDGIHFDVGHDLVNAAFASANGFFGNDTQESRASRGRPSSPIGMVIQHVKNLY
ncbi:hypothetical protein NOR_06127 [Metarhizium rileyi]|uniref:Biotin-protein ligase N-terminal domain-containing protein n=1 Tax=Metarhizium rileyi (strain RCEF 4871) TaxID=1649241 RepID=A0A167B6N6_METRR|nr:hypothetical protein NOR_06127 [Metarhizium rileyi RCEF 4871]TWU75417.1 hypothetical protein ED733_003368 [Metarhizium rileyi]